MTPQELKNSILQLAIQGKLVEQRPEEGTAALLLKAIEKDRSDKIKTKQARANKNTELITDEDIPFDIPESWVWIRFGDLVNYSMGKTPPRAETQWWGGGFPWVSIADMPESGHVKQTKESVTAIALSEKFGYRISKADTLIMSFKLTVGRVSILDIDAVHNEAIISIYPFADHANTIQTYLFHILPFVTQYGDSKNAIKGKTLNDTSISNLLIPLPPLDEQKRIVAKIEELLPYIDRYEQAWSRLEEFNKRFPDDMKKAILQQAIQGKLVEQRPEEGNAEELYQQIQAEKQRLIKAGKIKIEKPLPEITEDEKPFDIPESWKWVHLDDIAWFLDAGKSPNCQKKPVKADEWGVITTTSIQLGFFDDAQNKILPETFAVKESMQVRVGDILITRAGPTNRTGVACLVEKCRYKLILSDKTLRINMTDQYMYKNYVVMVLNSPQIRRLIIGLMSGMDKQPVTISQDKYKTLLIPLPPLTEQKRIVAKLEALLPLCERLK